MLPFTEKMASVDSSNGPVIPLAFQKCIIRFAVLPRTDHYIVSFLPLWEHVWS